MELVHRIYFLILMIFNVSQHVEASIVSSFFSSVTNAVESVTTDSRLTANTSEMITTYGYTARTYQVTTDDGYILTVSRIPNSGPVVFLMHGIISSGDDWCTQGQTALPFQLADAGYDVYIGNARGSKYSKEHTNLTTDDEAFWDFSFHDIGYYDLPAMIDFALETSNKTKMVYVGHSQGTTVFYVMASLRPSYNDKISLMVSMATIAWLSHQRSTVLPLLVELQDQESLLMELMGLNAIMQYDTFWKTIMTKLCPANNFTMTLCATVIFTVTGVDYSQMNYTQFPIQFGHAPGGTSIKQLLHYAQLIKSGKFRQYDHRSSEKNQAAYGEDEPPAYPVGNVTAPVAIMSGKNDLLATSEDIEILISELPNVVLNYTVSHESFNHIDFLWAQDASDLLYNKTLVVIKSKAENI